MATQKTGSPGATFTERARRAQLIGITQDLIADYGYKGTSLQRIADAASITKAAVLYYFPSKAAVIEAAHNEVITALARDVAAAVDAAPPSQAPAAYIRAMVRHLDDHPQRVRIFAEAAVHDNTPHSRDERWRPLADLIEAGARHERIEVRNSRAVAVIIGGAIDGIIAEKLDDPSFNSLQAAEVLIAMLPKATKTEP